MDSPIDSGVSFRIQGPVISSASTFVYVSSAEDGDIGTYTLRPDGSLLPGARVEAGKRVMPMAVSPDKRFLVAAVRSEPFSALTYAIDRLSGALSLVGRGPLAESLPCISLDRTGRFLFGASYRGNLVSVNRVGRGGRVGKPIQVVPTARNAHAICVDNTNRYVFAPHLGTDQVLQFVFDRKSGRLKANTPPLLQLAPGTGPRQIVVSPDNRFAYLLSELVGTVSTLALDGRTGLLGLVGTESLLPPGSRLVPGMPRRGFDVPGADPSPRDASNDIWASDLHLTPDGRLLYALERTGSTITGFRVQRATGRLAYLASVPTERQPRGFAIDPSGRFVVVAGEKSELLSSYAIDRSSGALALVGRYATGKGSNWVEIVSFERRH